MSPALTTTRVDDAAGLAALAPEWWDLWRRTPEATPFQSPAWILPWWESFRPGELLVVAIRSGVRLVGLGLFYLEHGAERRVLPIGLALSDHLDVLLDPAVRTNAGQALVEGLWNERRRWDLWSLEELPPDATAWSLRTPPECREVVDIQSPCPVLPLFGDPARFRSELPSRKRRKLAMAGHRAERRGGIEIEYADRANLAALLETVMALHRERRVSFGDAGVFTDTRVRTFFAAAIERLFEAGLLRLFAVRIGDCRAAVYCGFRSGDKAFAWLSGFATEFARESPGVLMVAQAIEDAVAEGAREFHFLRGGEAYKYEWGATDRWNRRRVFRRTS